jgi:hypothetical protein
VFLFLWTNDLYFVILRVITVSNRHRIAGVTVHWEGSTCLRKKGHRRRKENWGKPVKIDPRHPKANHHVFRINGCARKLIPGHRFLKEAINEAIRLSKNCKNPNYTFVVMCKRRVVWPTPK